MKQPLVFAFFSTLFFLCLLYSDPPDPVTDLSVVEVRWRQVKLQWTVPVSTNPVVMYEIRTSTYKVLTTQQDWDTNSSETGYPYRIRITTSPLQGQTISYTITGLTNGIGYFFAIKSSTDTNGTVFSEIDTTPQRPYGLPINNSPSYFNLITPTNGIVVFTANPVFDWWDATDSDIDYGDNISYELYYSTNPGIIYGATPPSLIGANVIGNITTSYLLLNASLADNTTYYWRVKAIDTEGSTRWSPDDLSGRFVVNHTSEPPTTVNIFTPLNGSSVTTTNGVFFDWSDATDPDPNDIITYSIYLSTTQESFILQTSGISWSSVTILNPFTGSWIENTTYWWYVRTYDSSNLYSQSTTNWFIVNNTNDPPTQNYLVFPGTTVFIEPIPIIRTLNPTFYWTVATDPDPYSNVKYQLFISSYSSQPDEFNSFYYNTIPIYTTYYFFQNSLEEETTYYWRVRIWDEPYCGYAVFSSTVYWFFTNAVNLPPQPAILLFPEDNSTTSYFYPKFEWVVGSDLGFEGGVSSQTLVYWTENSTITISGLSPQTSIYIPVEPLKNNSTYYWKIITYDNGIPEPQLSTETVVNKFFISNSSPLPFNLISPENGKIVNTQTVQLFWEAAFEPDSEAVSYTVEYSTDKEFNVYISSSGLRFSLQETPNFVITNTIDNTTYFWRVTCFDPWNFNTKSISTYYFICDYIPQNPSAFNLIQPLNGQIVNKMYATFYWEHTSDPDPLDYVVKYTLVLSTSANFDTIKFSTDTTINFYFLPTGILELNTTYYWYVIAISSRSGYTVSSSTFYFYVYNVAPSSPILVSPLNNSIVNNQNINLLWQPVTEPENDEFYYIVYVSTTLWETQNVYLVGQNVNYLPLTLIDDTTYHWYVVALDTYNNISRSETYIFWSSYENLPPTTPSLIKPVNETIGLPYEFCWSTSVDTDIFDSVRYKLIISTVSDMSSAVISVLSMDTKFLLQDFYLPLGTYFWQVTSYDTKGSSATSQISTFSLINYTVLPLSPKNNEIVKLPIEFRFSEVIPVVASDTITYTLTYSSSFSFVPKTEVVLTTTFYTINFPFTAGILPGTTYFWYVEAKDSYNRKTASQVNKFFTPYKIPRSPTGLVISTTTEGIVLQWQTVSYNTDGSLFNDLLHYKIYRKYNLFSQEKQLVDTTTHTTYIHRTDPTTEYYYCVTAENLWGIESQESAYVRLINMEASETFVSEDGNVIITIPKKESISELTITRVFSEETEVYVRVYNIVCEKFKLENLAELSFGKPNNVEFYQLEYYDGHNWLPIHTKELAGRIVTFSQYLGKYRIVSLTQPQDTGLTILGCSPKKKILTLNNNGKNDYIEFIYKIGSYLSGELYDINGRKVCNLKNKQTHILYFSGQDENGNYLPPGIYVYYITSKPDDKFFTGTIVIKY